jgi:hypothetical protein
LPLFIDRFPFASWTDRTHTPPQLHWTVVLPVVVADPGLSVPPSQAPVQDWVLDTGHRGASLAWRRHLLDAGLDPDAFRSAGVINITTAVGGKTALPVRKADLWLVSNVPSLRGATWRLELDPGIAFKNVATLPDPHFNRPLIGIRTLSVARLRVEVDFAASTVSVWTPDPPSSPP